MMNKLSRYIAKLPAVHSDWQFVFFGSYIIHPRFLSFFGLIVFTLQLIQPSFLVSGTLDWRSWFSPWFLAPATQRLVLGTGVRPFLVPVFGTARKIASSDPIWGSKTSSQLIPLLHPIYFLSVLMFFLVEKGGDQDGEMQKLKLCWSLKN